MARTYDLTPRDRWAYCLEAVRTPSDDRTAPGGLGEPAVIQGEGGGEAMIRACSDDDLEEMLKVINLGAQVYKGVIPADRWREPYMPAEELAHEISDGVAFWCYELDSQVVGVAGLQDRGEVALIRHAYVRPSHQRQGIGGALLRYLTASTSKPILIGTWAASHWAISFYRKHGFQLERPRAMASLLRKYWAIPERQVATSVVLGDAKWFQRRESELS